MSNQVIMWSMLILPWFTLLLMKKEEVKRYMPVAVFAAFASMIIVDVGGTLKLWALRENIFPLSHVFPYHLGAVPVVTVWLFKFTYGRVWRYIAVDAAYNLLFAFLLLPFLAARGIRENIRASDLSLFFITTMEGMLLYLYQMWQEDALVPAAKKLFSPILHPAAAKPFSQDKDDNR